MLGGSRIDDHKGNAGPASCPCVQHMEAHQEQGGQVMDLLKEAGIGDRSSNVRGLVDTSVWAEYDPECLLL